MTRDEIAQAMQDTAGNSWGDEAHFQRFAALVIAAEREACAKGCYELFDKTGLWAALQLSDKIRARGSKPTSVIYSPGQLDERGLTHEDVVKLIKENT